MRGGALWSLKYDTHAWKVSQTTCCSHRPKNETSPHNEVFNSKLFAFITISKLILETQFEMEGKEYHQIIIY
jgi:hypothetical protein